MLAEKFEEFIKNIEVNSAEEEMKKVKEIVKRLNKSFYGTDKEDEENSYVVGSLGRKTAIKTYSDVDILFVLPKKLKNQYDQLKGNGQSKLLQKVKDEIKKRYPKTIVRGDGQVVEVSFKSLDIVVEVCPCFERSDGAFDYPDSNNGGTWKKTDPLPEVEESEIMIEKTNENYKHMCNMLRAWKNNIGFKFGGLLIDTLVYNFFKENKEYYNVDFDEYLYFLKDMFKYLEQQDKNQKYWYALGSNQHVYNHKGTFINKAKQAYKDLKDVTEESDELYDKLRNILGKEFPMSVEVSNRLELEKSLLTEQGVLLTEEFIKDKYRVDIKYDLEIDCIVKQNGYREFHLSDMWKRNIYLKTGRKLEFFIKQNEFSRKFGNRLKYKIYWKVLNKGPLAIKKNCIRGQITRDKGEEKKVESTTFKGNHYVECYLVYNNICVAKDRITVPISIVK